MTTATGEAGWDPEMDGKVEGHFSHTIRRFPDGTWQAVAADGTEGPRGDRDTMLAWLSETSTDDSSPAWVPGYETNVRPEGNP